MTYLTLRLVHILFMATWIGSVMFMTGDVRRTVQAGPVHLDLLRDRVRRFARLGGASALITIVTGVALIVNVGGMGAVSPAIHTGLTLGLVAWGVSGGVIGGGWRKLDAGLASGQDAATLAPFLMRMRIGAMVFHSLWLVILILMVFRSQIG